LGAGLIAGIEGQIPHATVAGKLLVDSTGKTMRLAGKIESPSKVTQEIGQFLTDGFVIGRTKSATSVRSGAERLVNLVTTAFDKGRVDAAGEAVAKSLIIVDEAQLLGLSGKETALQTRLTAAETRLTF
jgi:hypothetical protein